VLISISPALRRPFAARHNESEGQVKHTGKSDLLPRSRKVDGAGIYRQPVFGYVEVEH
jgi:hypothetical protein